MNIQKLLQNDSVPFLTHQYVSMMPPKRRNIPIVIPITLPIPILSSGADPANERDNIRVHNPDKYTKHCQMCSLLNFTSLNAYNIMQYIRH